MPTFSNISLERLSQVHPDLQTLFHEVIKHSDCAIISGVRTDEEQQELYAKGRTDGGEIVTYKDGIVNKSRHQLGRAVDAAPYPINWKDTDRFRAFGWFVKDIAKSLKRDGKIDYDITWGGDWKWKDFAHFEI